MWRCVPGCSPSCTFKRCPRVRHIGNSVAVLALAGKTLRGAHVRAADGGIYLPHLVSVLDQRSGTVLGQVQVSEKGSDHRCGGGAGEDSRERGVEHALAWATGAQVGRPALLIGRRNS